MNERGSVTLEGLLSWILLLGLFLLLAVIARRGVHDRLEQHANFLHARSALAK